MSTTETTKTAFQIGQEAFAQSVIRRAVADPAFNAQFSETDFAAMRDWYNGWDTANLAASLPDDGE